MGREKQYKIDLVLDEDHYKDLLDKCKKYKEHHGTEITPKEYILMLLQLAVDQSLFSYGGKDIDKRIKKSFIPSSNLYFRGATKNISLMHNKGRLRTNEQLCKQIICRFFRTALSIS